MNSTSTTTLDNVINHVLKDLLIGDGIPSDYNYGWVEPVTEDYVIPIGRSDIRDSIFNQVLPTFEIDESGEWALKLFLETGIPVFPIPLADLDEESAKLMNSMVPVNSLTPPSEIYVPENKRNGFTNTAVVRGILFNRLMNYSYIDHFIDYVYEVLMTHQFPGGDFRYESPLHEVKIIAKSIDTRSIKHSTRKEVIPNETKDEWADFI